MSKSIGRIESNDVAVTDLISIGSIVGRFTWLALVATVAPLCLYIDVHILNNRVQENSLVEISQGVFLIMSAACFAYLAYRRKDDKAFSALASAFFICLLIREMDQVFDVIVHGLWKYIAAPIALTAITYAYRNSRDVLAGLTRFLRSQAGTVMLVGLVVLLFFSRLMGMSEVWQSMMGDGYIRTVKNAVEETSELLGYSLIFAASIRYMLHRLRAKKRINAPQLSV